MITHFTGQLLEVEPTEYTDRKTGKTIYQTLATVLFEGLNEAGYKKVSTESVKLDEEDFDRLAPHIGKYVSIAYETTVNEYGTKTYPSRDMPVITHEKNPFDYEAYRRTPKSGAKTA